LIQVNDVTKSFKDHKVLDGVSFSAHPGRILALLGSNGAGKTTIIRIISTLLSMDSGSVSICGFDLKKEANQIRESISLTGQFATVDKELTGRENLLMITALRHVPNKKQVASDLLEKFNLTDAGDQLASSYSGGMRRRLDIAMSFIGDAPVVFLDEPTTGLDPQNRLAMWKMVKEISDSGRTVLLTTQYLEEAEFLADDIAILHQGKIISQGSAEALKKQFSTAAIEVNVLSPEDLTLLQEVLGGHSITINDKLLSAQITTNGSFEHTFSILHKLELANVNILDFSYQKAKLEDIFLSLIGEGGKQNDA